MACAVYSDMYVPETRAPRTEVTRPVAEGHKEPSSETVLQPDGFQTALDS